MRIVLTGLALARLHIAASSSIVSYPNDLFSEPLDEFQTVFLYGGRNPWSPPLGKTVQLTSGSEEWCRTSESQEWCLGIPLEGEEAARLKGKFVYFDLPASRVCALCDGFENIAEWCADRGALGVIRSVTGQAGHGLVTFGQGFGVSNSRRKDLEAKNVIVMELSVSADPQMKDFAASLATLNTTTEESGVTVVLVAEDNPWSSLSGGFEVVYILATAGICLFVLCYAFRKLLGFWRHKGATKRTFCEKAQSLPVLVCAGNSVIAFTRMVFCLDPIGHGYLHGWTWKRVLLTLDLPWRFAVTLLVGIHFSQLQSQATSMRRPGLSKERRRFVISIGIVMLVVDLVYTALMLSIPDVGSSILGMCVLTSRHPRERDIAPSCAEKGTKDPRPIPYPPTIGARAGSSSAA